MQRLQHGSLDLEEAQSLEVFTHSAHNGYAGDHHATGVVTHNQVGVAVADAGVLIHVGKGHGQGAQRLCRQCPGRREHRQLAAARRHHTATNGHEVAHIDVGLPAFEGVLPHLCER